AKKAPAKKAPAKKAPAKKAPAKPAPTAKKAATKKAPAKAAPAKKAPAIKSPAKSVKPAAPKDTPKKSAKDTPKKTGTDKPNKEVAKKAASKEAPVKGKAAKETPKPEVVAPPAPPVINPIAGAEIPQVRKAVPGKKAAPKQPAVQEDESNWTKPELERARKMLEREAAELVAEIAAADEKFQDLIFESGEGAGDDQADAGTKTFEREQEISLLANKRDLLDQTHHALERIAAGTYGRCENCTNPIGKLRLLEANPRATLCMPCRQKQDRG
ncbi:MAG: TraR/DksA C4-type zinc finger protein, partial [Actinomycetales bacterium]|nr:TraR/DksA C4-type zinc finger protein [Actinomycetales bacterium]